MRSFEQRIRKTINSYRLITPDQSVVVAVSGGPDSICLLHALCNLCGESAITCVYVDHNLRPEESVRERNVVEAHCIQRSIDFIDVSVDVPATVGATGESIEACARRLRYDALEDVRCSKKAELIAVGHSADDQVEEVLLRLIRGSGLKGLSGMRPKYGRVIRPLLEVSRQEVLTYLEANGYEFCHDSSNESLRFLRNRIRLELLPLLEERFNPSIRNTILNTARVLEIEEEFLSGGSNRLYKSLATLTTHGQPSISFALEALSAIPAALRRRIFERACWDIGCRPEFKTIERTDALMAEPASGAELHLPDGVRVLQQYDSLIFSRLAADRGPRERLTQRIEVRQEITKPGSYFIGELGGQLEIMLADCIEPVDEKTMRLDAESITFPLRLRSVEPGDRFTPLGAPGRKKVARFLGDRKVPKHRRAYHPILDSAQGIICVLGQEIDERCRVSDTTRHCVLIRWECSSG